LKSHLVRFLKVPFQLEVDKIKGWFASLLWIFIGIGCWACALAICNNIIHQTLGLSSQMKIN